MGHADAKLKDTLGDALKRAPRRMRTVSEKRRIVEETFKPGASVAVVARRHEVNANLVFGWRRLYQQGLLEPQPALTAVPMLPVKVSAPTLIPTTSPVRGKPGKLERRVAPSSGWIEIELSGGERVRVHGSVEREALARIIDILLRR